MDGNKVMSLEKDHLHIYKRSKSKHIYKCMHPDCTHFTDKDFLEGKRARCLKCQEPFVLTKMQLNNLIPRCSNCSNAIKDKTLRNLSSALDEALKESSLL